jgi:RHS repeat-associated protein
VSDIYTATEDELGNVIEGLAGATVKVQNQSVPNVEQTLTTGAAGEALFNDLPAGLYSYRASAPNHRDTAGYFWVKPGITVAEDVFLSFNLVSVEWSVTEISIEDRYEITLTSTFETDVPAAVVVIEPASVQLPEMQPGDVYYGEFTLTNYGLIPADNLRLDFPIDAQAYSVEVLTDLPETLGSKERVAVPFRVVALHGVEGAAAAGATGGGECTAALMAIRVTVDYMCSNGQKESGSATLSIFALEGECGSSSSGSSRPFSAALESLLTLFSYSGQGTGGGNFVGASQPSLSSGPQPISNVFCWPVGIGLEALFDPNGSPLLDRIIDLLQKVGCAVNAAVREFNDEALDLRVKMPGGFADVLRRFYDNQWHWEHSRLNVRPGYDLPTIVYGRPASGAMLVRPALSEINKGGVIYYGVGPWSVTSDDTLVADLYVHGTYKIIRHDTGYRWEDKHGNWMNYDANGRLLTSGSRIGTQWQAIYGAEEDGEATGIADRNGRQVLWFEHNGEGLLSAAYDAAGRRVEYQYTDSRLTGVVDAGGRESRYEYDGGGRMVRRIDPEGHVTLVSYDAQGNVIRVEDASGRGTSFDYAYDEIAKESYAQVRSPTGKITEVWYNLDSQTTRVDVNGRTVKVFRDTDNGFSVTDEKGNVTVKELDKFQNLTRIVFPEGTAASFTYEPVYNQVTRVVDPRGFRHDFQYDARGNLVRKIEAVGSPSERTTSYTYDAVGQLITATIEGDARTAAATIRFSYDADGNIASIMDGEGNTIAFPSFDVAGNVLQIRDPLGRIWGSSYDALDRRVSRTDPLGHVTRYEYDRVNNLSALVDAADKRFEYEYNEYNYLTRALDPYGLALSIDYNPDNLPTRILDQEGKETRTDYDNETRLRRLIDGAGNVTSYQYDESPTNVAVSDNPVRIDYPTFSQELSYDRLQQVIEGSDVLDAETTYSRPYAYDAVGNLVSATDEEGNTTRFDYDGLNRLTRIIDAQGNVTERVFDARNNVVAVTDSNGGTTRSEYDRANRLVRTTRPMGQVTTYAYDAAGNLTSVVDAKGQKIVYGYDELHRLVRADYYAAGDHVTPVKTDQFAYDALNQLVSYDDGSTSATYTYDDVGRKTGVTVDYGPFSLSYAYTYYGNGLKASFTGPNGLTYHYIYDANNRLSAVELPDGSQVGYDAYQWNSPTQITLPGGNKLTYGYDPLMRLEAISAEDVSAGTVLDHQIAYSPAGDVSQRITEHGDYLYHYDLLHQLTDAHNAVLTDEAYTYDPLGNRLSAAGVGGLIDHNLNNELVQYGDTSFEYDPNGNLTRSLSPSQDVRFIYDIKDRLVRIERADGTVLAEYYYNPFGRRLWKDVLGVRTHYFYADEGLIGEYDAGGDEVKTYGYVPDSEWTTDPLFQEVGGRHYWYVNDHAGTPQKLVDSAGSTVWSAKYDAFGNAAIDVAVISNNLRLPGQYFDAESGLHYNWHRYYDPRIGRYLTLDPLGTGLNPYVYALNNPLALIDPEGTHAVAAYAGISSLLAGGLPLWAILYVSDNLVADILSLLWGEEVDALGALLLQQLPVVPRWLANLLYGIGGQAALSMGSRGYPTPIFSSAAGPDDLASATKGGTIPGQKNWPEFTKDWKLGKPSRLKEGEVYGKLSKYSPKGEEILYGGDAKHLPHFDYRAKPGGQWYNIDETGQLYFRGYHYKGENLEQGNWVFK